MKLTDEEVEECFQGAYGHGTAAYEAARGAKEAMMAEKKEEEIVKKAARRRRRKRARARRRPRRAWPRRARPRRPRRARRPRPRRARRRRRRSRNRPVLRNGSAAAAAAAARGGVFVRDVESVPRFVTATCISPESESGGAVCCCSIRSAGTGVRVSYLSANPSPSRCTADAQLRTRGFADAKRPSHAKVALILVTFRRGCDPKSTHGALTA